MSFPGSYAEVRAAIARHRPRLNRRELIDRCARAERHLDIKTAAYDRLLADNGHRGMHVKLAEELIGRIEATLAAPGQRGAGGGQHGPGSAMHDLEAIRHNVAANLGAYRRALEESDLYHAATVDPDGGYGGGAYTIAKADTEAPA